METATPQKKAPTRAEILKDFDNLPDAAQARVPTVAALIDASIPTVWRMAAEGRLPKPRRIGKKHTAWNVGELRAALKALPA